MIEVLVSVCLLTGAALMLMAAIGIIRLPDLPTRMHATTKSGVLGAMLIMVAVALAFAQLTVSARVLAIIAFVALTVPVAAHVLGRAGYLIGVPLWPGTVKDALKEYLDDENESGVSEIAAAERDEHESSNGR